ncbi:MAG: hypothetical protein ABIS86_17000 [Streptosporangiaceae bacterium]
MKAPTRLWWNADRSRLVEDGGEEAAFLAYRQGEEVEELHEGLLGSPDPEPVKQARPVPNKARRPAENKSGA